MNFASAHFETTSSLSRKGVGQSKRKGVGQSNQHILKQRRVSVEKVSANQKMLLIDTEFGIAVFPFHPHPKNDLESALSAFSPLLDETNLGAKQRIELFESTLEFYGKNLDKKPAFF